VTRILLHAASAAGAALVALALALAPAGSLAAEAGSVGPIDLNTATVEELVALPGVGEAKARAIVEAREQRGGFDSVDELLEVRGIGEKALEQLRPLLTVGAGRSGRSSTGR
jgi:competence protein ComEA